MVGHHLLDGSGGDVGGAAGDVWMGELVGSPREVMRSVDVRAYSAMRSE